MLMRLSASLDGLQRPLHALDLRLWLLVILEVCLDAAPQNCFSVGCVRASVVSGTTGFIGLSATICHSDAKCSGLTTNINNNINK